MEQGVLYYYQHSNGDMTVSDLFYTYDYSEKIYKVMNGNVFCIMEDKWVHEYPVHIPEHDWCIILMKCNGVKRLPPL